MTLDNLKRANALHIQIVCLQEKIDVLDDDHDIGFQHNSMGMSFTMKCEPGSGEENIAYDFVTQLISHYASKKGLLEAQLKSL